jgi:FHS family Na+ dependent glucose MFS transporter 1
VSRIILSRLHISTTAQALRRTLAYYLLFIGLGLASAVLGPTLPMLAGQTHSRLGQMGFLFLAGSLGYTLGTLAGGRVYGRRHGHRILGGAQIAAALPLVLVPIVPELWLLALALAIKGLADGLVNTGANTLLLWTHGERVGPFMNGLHFCFGLGAFIAPFLVAQTVSFNIPYAWVFWGLAAFNVLVGLRTLVLPGTPGPPPPSAHSASDAARTDSMRLVVIAALFLFFYVGAEIAFGGWLYTYATTLGLAGPAAAAYLTSFFWLSFTIGRLLSIAAAVRFAPRRIVLFALLGCLGFIGLVLAVPASSLVLWGATIGLAFCMAPIWPTGFTLAGQIITLNAHTTSLVLLGDSLGALVLPWLVGQLLDAAGPRAMVYLVFASLAATLVAFWGLRKRS